MKVDNVLNLARVRLGNLQVSRNEKALLDFINLGLVELYRRFNLSTKMETIDVMPDKSLYELKNDDVAMMLALYDMYGKELRQTDVMNSIEYDYKLVNYRSFILHKCKGDRVYAVYQALPIEVKDKNDEVELPDTMITALLGYITYMGHNTINRDNQNSSAMYYKQFEELCANLINQGYNISLSNETVKLQDKGFV